MASTSQSEQPIDTDFEAIIDLLTHAGVKFVLIGGLAANIHGSATVTYDVDVCYERSADNIQRLCDALAVINPTLRGVDSPPDLPFRFDARTVQQGLNFTLNTDLGERDLLGEVQPIGGYSEVVSQSSRMELFGHSVHVLSLRALIAAKRFAGRPKDLLTLPELEALLAMQEGRDE